MKHEIGFGIFTGSIVSIMQTDIVSSVLAAAIGATVSFFVTMGLKWVVKKLKE